MFSKKGIIFSGILLGILSVFLVLQGNPLNMGFCIACFWRDIAGSLGLQRALVVQYIRPEIIGLGLGSFFIALINKEFKVTSGSSPVLRFILGFITMIGALVFLGCPLRAILRLANGDLNALVGLLGYVFGIVLGSFVLKKGFSLGRAYPQPKLNGVVFPTFLVGLLVLLIVAPTFIFFSSEGSGSMSAPLFISLGAGLILGIVLQRTRLCTVGGFRDAILIKDYHLLIGLLALFLTTLAGNLIFNFESFNLGFANQPIAHTEHLWNFLGMSVVGIAACLLGGCPLRQTILAGQGDGDAFITVIGMIVGASISHNFGLASSPDGVPFNGKIAVVISFIILGLISYFIIQHEKKKKLRSE